jgi:two-component system sensor histidine kinase VicK
MSYVSIFEGLWRQAESYEQLKAHEKIQKEFINIAAHEIRTPAQTILGYSELAQAFSPEGGKEMLITIYKNAKRLQRLIEDTLDITRIESQTLKLNKEEINLNEKIRNIINDLKTQIHNPDKLKIISLELKQPIYVKADKVRIYQVIANLFNNAIKFTEEGTISALADVKTNDEAIITIKGTGTGVDAEIMPRLFTKFAARSITGTGLGLFICKSIVEAHDGKIWTENNNEGATFAFSLPLKAIE